MRQNLRRQRIRPHLRMSNGSWRVDETREGQGPLDLSVLDLSVSSGRQPGQTIDFLPSAKRDAEAAKRFFRKALAQGLNSIVVERGNLLI